MFGSYCLDPLHKCLFVPRSHIRYLFFLVENGIKERHGGTWLMITIFLFFVCNSLISATAETLAAPASVISRAYRYTLAWV
jgi:hypothetical protein